MDTKTKIIAAIIALSLFALMGYVIKTQRDTIAALQQNTEEQRFLKDEITAVKSSYLTSKQFDERLTLLDMDINVIEQEVRKTGSKIDGIIVASNKTPGTIQTGVGSTGVKPKDPTTPITPPCPEDKYGYLNKVPYLQLDEPMKTGSVPFGEVAFDATKEKPWSYEIYPRTYSTSIVLATDNVGRKTAFAKMTIATKDKTYDMPETQVAFNERLPEAKFYPWVPRVLIGADVGFSTKPGLNYGPTLQFYAAAYGKIQTQPDWYIGGLGLGYNIADNKFQAVISPFAYKLNVVSVLHNVTVAPSFAIDFSGNYSFGGGFRVAL